MAAKDLLQVEGIDVVHDAESVTYVHYLLDRHQIVESEGADTESLFTGFEMYNVRAFGTELLN